MVGKRDTLENRLWAKVLVTDADECWPWLATKNNKGYGLLSIDAKTGKKLAHRIVYTLTKGNIPDGLVVMHSCDNPSCCNPAHLSCGTQLDNMRDKLGKSRGNNRWGGNPPPRFSGESHPKATVSEETVRAIRLSKKSRKEIALEFSISEGLVKSIRSRQTWKHII